MLRSLVIALCATSASAIWPIPSTYTSGGEVLWITRDVAINYKTANETTHGYGSPSNNSSWSSDIVTSAVERTYDTLFTKNFVQWKFHPRFSDYEPALTSNSTYVKSITLYQTAADPSTIMKPTAGSVDESYTLDVLASGEATITAASSIGLLYGLTTFTQLFYECNGGGVYTTLAPVHITDSPKFPWRGLNIDTSRTFKPMSDMYAMVDALSYNKMNRLHWHITDAQSWPLEIPTMPELADKGAYASFQKYSPADVAALQEYGALLGVEVVMEIDNPGHTSSIAFAYPDLIAAFNEADWSSYASEPPSGTLKLNSTAVYDFLERLLDDLLPRLKPLTSYFHLGGDEVNVNAYTLDNTVGTNSTAILQPLMQKYMDRNIQQVQAAGLVPLVWEEMLLDWNLTLPSETIVQTWLSDESVAATVAKGHKALAGNYNFWYLDCGQGQWLDFYPGTSSAEYWPYADYCSPRHNWRLMYSYDPLGGVPENSTHLVLGGEAHIWSEQTDTVNLDQMVWPRTCAAGEVLWSGAKDASGQNRSQITASPRLSEMRERLVARGARKPCFCLTDSDASDLVAGFTTIAAEHTGYEGVADQILVDNFTSISDSVNFVDGIPLNTTMTTSRAQLLQQEAKLPPTGKVTDLFISHTCDTITWYFEFGTTPLPTRGIAILFVNAEKKIYKAYREINSAALLYNVGRPECTSNWTATVGDTGPVSSNSTCKSCLEGRTGD
ncbi:hypothetical protein LTR65_007739 [Meristemomyces frigidus]